MLFFYGMHRLHYRVPLFNGGGSCKPQLAHTILEEPGMKEALDNKLLISILAGVTLSQLNEWILPSTTVIRAMPNTPCKVTLHPAVVQRRY